MAILEINLEKPALIEEYQFPDETDASTSRTGVTSSGHNESKSSGGGKGKLLGLLVVLAGIGVAVWKLKGGSGSKQTDVDEDADHEEGEYEHGPDPEIGGDKKYAVKRKVKSKVSGTLGLAVAVVGLAVVVALRKARK